MATLSPPQSPNGQDYRPRADRVLSFTSTRSRRSSGSGNKLELTESARDKRKLATTSKADPRAALNEAQPAVVALEESNLEDLRAFRHKDNKGNVITDPDLSNPTRPRLERPLDTIRGFNAAAEGTSNRRSSYHSRPSPGLGQDSYARRPSQYGNYSSGPHTSPQRPGGYYRSSSYGLRPNGYYEEPQAPQYPRQQLQQPQQQPQGHYGEYTPPYLQQQMYDAATSGSEEYGKSTNPSSQNSSFDRLQQVQQRKPEGYPQYYEQDSNGHGSSFQNGFRGYPSPVDQPGDVSDMLPLPQQHRMRQQAPPARAPIRLSNYDSPPSTLQPTRSNTNKPLPQKRQSWIKRTFSRRNS